MVQAQAKLTAQGQVLVSAAIRQLLNVTPGAVLAVVTNVLVRRFDRGLAKLEGAKRL